MPDRPGIVIAGGGLVAQRASAALRRHGFDGPIRIVAAEDRLPYDRPPLSKGFLAGEVDADALALRPPAWYAEQRIEVLTGRVAAGLDVRGRALLLAGGERLPFERLLIATGSRACSLPEAGRFSNLHVLRTVEDARRLRRALVPGARLVVAGAGFVGLEVAATALARGASVAVVDSQPAPLASLLGRRIAAWLARLHREAGVELIPSARVVGLHGADRVREVALGDGRRLACDALLLAIGALPATEWLRACGLDRGGVPTSAAGRTAAPGVFAAGDASLPFDPRTGTHVRGEHWEAAVRQADAAARAMLGVPVPAPAVPSFWSDQHGVRINVVGRPAGADGLTLDGDPAGHDFTAIFTDAGRPVAALAAGRPWALPELRRRIEAASVPEAERNAA